MSTVVDRSVSTLNPNAPVFDPVGFREVEDFSPKWWELVTTSKWFRDFWLSSNSEYEFSDMEEDEDFEELIMTSSGEAEMGGSTVRESDVGRYLKVLLCMAEESTKGKLYRSNVSCSAKYNQKKKMNPNFYCRRNHHIYQPR
ncbi:hypothetical protein Bca52824_008623 [Brassica carinata]|uniref:Uncharacterized protein n=1 Tax=Brassica carinata TaxID=52824 RepID=A0A8X7WB57_BRACI|nr:hypothetical protein Bca52824_008623 [Brassica carinata]